MAKLNGLLLFERKIIKAPDFEFRIGLYGQRNIFCHTGAMICDVWADIFAWTTNIELNIGSIGGAKSFIKK